MSVVAAQQLPGIDNALSAAFPLPLTAFEWFMLADDRPDFPMMCDMEMQFQGRVERGALESAVAFALARNPLFRCLVERRRRGPPVWVLTDRQPPITWVDLNQPLDDRYGAFTDLTAEPGLRIWVRQGAEHAKVLLNFHHACSDGIGAFGFIEDLLTGYAAATPGAAPLEPRPIELGLLERRGQRGMVGRGLRQRLYDAVVGPREGIKFFLKSPPPLASVPQDREAATVQPSRPGFITAVCPPDVAARLRRLATKSGVTTNDVLMRDMFWVLRRWNVTHDPSLARHWMRVLMPQNLRDREDGRMPAANVMSFTFVARHSDLCDQPQRLLQSIHEETEAIRRGKLGVYFTGALVSGQATGILPWLLRTQLCFATAVLTNLSDPTRRFVTRFPRVPQGIVVGDLVLEGIAGAPPIRPYTHASFTIFNAARTFSVCLRWNPRHYSLSDAQSLLGAYITQLQSTSETAESSP